MMSFGHCVIGFFIFIFFLSLSHVPSDYLDRVGFMTTSWFGHLVQHLAQCNVRLFGLGLSQLR